MFALFMNLGLALRNSTVACRNVQTTLWYCGYSLWALHLNATSSLTIPNWSSCIRVMQIYQEQCQTLAGPRLFNVMVWGFFFSIILNWMFVFVTFKISSLDTSLWALEMMIDIRHCFWHFIDWAFNGVFAKNTHCTLGQQTVIHIFMVCHLICDN